MWTYQRIQPTHHATRPGRLTLLAALLLAGALAAAGCGESSKPSAAATAQTTSTPSTGAQAAGSTTGAPRAGAPAGQATTGSPARNSANAAPAGSAPASGKHRAHLVLPPPGSHPEPKLTASQAATLPVTDIDLSSTAIKQHAGSSQSAIANQYTCHGADRTPPLHWSNLPSNTRELALFAISTRPVNDKLYYDWAIAGLNPKLTGLNAGQLPPATITGQNSAGHAGYTLCPPAGKPENYVFLLYALPTSLNPKQGFNPQTLRTQAKQVARHTGLLVGTYG
jgi:phosphatidylethanolamine-binding protein (PEBP) family uncharacterized protein